MSRCMWSGWKLWRVVKEIAFLPMLSSESRMFVKENQGKKNCKIRDLSMISSTPIKLILRVLRVPCSLELVNTIIIEMGYCFSNSLILSCRTWYPILLSWPSWTWANLKTFGYTIISKWQLFKINFSNFVF